MKTPNLLPCPFCGSEPTVESWHGGAATKVMISCDNMACEPGPQVTGETPKEAAKRWNRRSDAALMALSKNAQRWRKARELFSIEDIERAVDAMRGCVPDEAQNLKADSAIDSVMKE